MMHVSCAHLFESFFCTNQLLLYYLITMHRHIFCTSSFLSGKSSHKDVKHTGNWLLKLYYGYRPFMAFCCVSCEVCDSSYIALSIRSMILVCGFNPCKCRKLDSWMLCCGLSNISTVSTSRSFYSANKIILYVSPSNLFLALQVLYIILFLFADEKSTSLLSVRWHHFYIFFFYWYPSRIAYDVSVSTF
jgi:Mn2+/Fe2+ NRAMP family transporter